MLEAVVWGLVASSSFVFGGALALVRPPRPSWVSLGAGVGAGALMGAVAYELIDEAGAHAGRPFVIAAGLLGGAFLATSIFVGPGGLRRELASAALPPPMIQHRFATLLLSVASEVIIIVGALGHGLSLAVIVAVFLCGVPEAVVGTVSMREEGASRRRVMETWIALAGYGGLVAIPAYLVVSSAAGNLVAAFLSVAGGVVLSTIAAHLVPTSYARLGALCAFPVVAGFALSVALVGIG